MGIRFVTDSQRAKLLRSLFQDNLPDSQPLSAESIQFLFAYIDTLETELERTTDAQFRDTTTSVTITWRKRSHVHRTMRKEITPRGSRKPRPRSRSRSTAPPSQPQVIERDAPHHKSSKRSVMLLPPAALVRAPAGKNLTALVKGPAGANMSDALKKNLTALRWRLGHLMDVSRLEAGQEALKIAAFNAAHRLKKFRESMRSAATERRRRKIFWLPRR